MKTSYSNGGGYRRASNTSRPTGGRRVFNTRGGGRGRGGRNTKRIDENLFIQKAIKKDIAEYVPKHTFGDFEIHEEFKKTILARGYTIPTSIQDQAIPVALEGGDIIGIASTGTGKTAAFLIPLVDAILSKEGNGAIILAPTRELAEQIRAELVSLTEGLGIFSVLCVGGMPIRIQMQNLSRGAHIIVGTPGRVRDLIDRRRLNPASFDAVVLDEADRMLDMGFIDDMKYILGMMPDEKQSMFFSATFSEDIRRLSNQFLQNPTTIKIPSRDTAASVEQDIVRVGHSRHKVEVLNDILMEDHCTKTIVFRERKSDCEELLVELMSRGHDVVALHGDMEHRQRMVAVKAFKQGDANVLIATDVAARGIDIPDVSHVINFDQPKDYETYIHRIGRTGRANKTGIALTFVS